VYAPRWLYGALKKTLEAPYTTKVNNRETIPAVELPTPVSRVCRDLYCSRDRAAGERERRDRRGPDRHATASHVCVAVCVLCVCGRAAFCLLLFLLRGARRPARGISYFYTTSHLR